MNLARFPPAHRIWQKYSEHEYILLPRAAHRSYANRFAQGLSVYCRCLPDGSGCWRRVACGHQAVPRSVSEMCHPITLKYIGNHTRHQPEFKDPMEPPAQALPFDQDSLAVALTALPTNGRFHRKVVLPSTTK